MLDLGERFILERLTSAMSQSFHNGLTVKLVLRLNYASLQIPQHVITHVLLVAPVWSGKVTGLAGRVN